MDDSLLERNLAFRTPVCGDLMHDASATRRLAHDCYLARIAAELRDVLLYPLKRESLIEEAGVGCAVLMFECWTGEESLMMLAKKNDGRRGDVSLTKSPTR